MAVAQSRATRAATENARAGSTPACTSATPRVRGPRDLRLDARRRARQRDRGVDEPNESRVGFGLQLDRNRRARIDDPGDRERTVVVDDDTRHAVHPLREHTLPHAAVWELRHRRELGETAENERRSRTGVAMRKAADTSGHPCSEHGRRHEIRSIRTPFELLGMQARQLGSHAKPLVVVRAAGVGSAADHHRKRAGRRTERLVDRARHTRRGVVVGCVGRGARRAARAAPVGPHARACRRADRGAPCDRGRALHLDGQCRRRDRIFAPRRRAHTRGAVRASDGERARLRRRSALPAARPDTAAAPAGPARDRPRRRGGRDRAIAARRRSRPSSESSRSSSASRSRRSSCGRCTGCRGGGS